MNKKNRPKRAMSVRNDTLNDNQTSVEMTQKVSELAELREKVELLSGRLEALQIMNDGLSKEKSKLRKSCQQLFDQAPLGYLLLDEKGLIVKANFAIASIFQTDVDALVGRRFSYFLTEKDAEQFTVRFPALYRSQGKKTILLNASIDSLVIPVRLEFNNQENFKLQNDTICISVIDESEIQTLKSDLTLHSKFFHLSRFSCAVVESSGNFSSVNQAYIDLMECVDIDNTCNLREFLSTQGDNTYSKVLIEINKSGAWHARIKLTKYSGEAFDADVYINGVADDNGIYTHYLLSFRNISREIKADEEIKHLAQYDNLTGLPNRYLLGDRLRQSIKLAKRHESKIAVMFMDLDNFKSLNDNKGHVAGDELLVQVAKRMRSVFRESDTVSRFGGDEFVIIMDEFQGDNIKGDIRELSKKLARKLLSTIRKPYSIYGETFRTSFSIGISIFPDDAQNAEALISSADLAMYQAKSNGKGNVCFFDITLKNSIKNDNLVHSELLNAIDNNEFRLYFQPQVDLETKKVVAAEALLRWMHPKKGLLSPAYFLSAAEKFKLMPQIDAWVLEETCKQLRLWRDLKRELVPIGINLTHHQFVEHANTVNNISKTLERYHISPKWLNIEILESGLMKDIKSATYILESLHELGVKVALDDFGTGYSSLNHLRHFPINCLKIDQSFIRGMVDNKSNKSLVRAILALSRELELTTLAEGIETEEQRSILLAMNCNLGQGYLFDKPMSGYDFHRRYLNPNV